MSARADNGDLPARIIRKVYTADFLTKLGGRFHFDGQNPEITAQIIRMGISYIALRRRENDSDMRELRRQFDKLAKEITAFRNSLENAQDLDLPATMYFSALQSGEPAPATKFAGLTDHERRQSGEPYFRELLRLLNILAEGLKDQIGRSAPKRGPRVNWGLENLTLKSAQFFAVEFGGRPFTIDPHKPFKPTQAFDFVKALVTPLDTVTDDDIVTAIRAAKSCLKNKPGTHKIGGR